MYNGQGLVILSYIRPPTTTHSRVLSIVAAISCLFVVFCILFVLCFVFNVVCVSGLSMLDCPFGFP